MTDKTNKISDRARHVLRYVLAIKWYNSKKAFKVRKNRERSAIVSMGGGR